jgi:peptidoglycan/LPS O-acetylase OafA/YrhL
VISGFCLYAPFAGGRLNRFNTSSFLLRRCRRLLPAYYTALAAGVLLTLVGAGWLGFSHLSLREVGWQVVTHLTLTQTFFPTTFYAINGAYWSLGLEWQLYFALPLLIIAIRRFGLGRTLCAAILCNVVYRLGLEVVIHVGFIRAGTVLATVVLPNQLPGRCGEFVLGVLAAELYATGRVRIWARYLRLSFVALVPASIILAGRPLSHLLFGGVFFALLCVVLAEDNVVSRALSWRPLVGVGVMSYSLYLVHQPLIQAVAYSMHSYASMSGGESFVALVLLLPVVVFVAWILFISVERWTLSSRSDPLQQLWIHAIRGTRRANPENRRLTSATLESSPRESR